MRISIYSLVGGGISDRYDLTFKYFRKQTATVKPGVKWQMKLIWVYRVDI